MPGMGPRAKLKNFFTKRKHVMVLHTCEFSLAGLFPNYIYDRTATLTFSVKRDLSPTYPR